MKIELKRIGGDWRCVMTYDNQSFIVGDGRLKWEAKFTKRMLEIAFEHYEADKKRHKSRSQQ